MRGSGIECQRIARHQPKRFESDDGFELALQVVKVFPTVVPEGLPALGGLTAGFVHDLVEFDPAVVDRSEAFPAHASRKFDGVAVARPLHDARSPRAGGATPRAADRRRARRLVRFDLNFSEK